jgi:fructuronate reductase
MGIDDQGNAFTPSPDPRLAEESAYVASVKLGDKGPFDEVLRPILSDTTLFGVDLYATGLAPLVIRYFTEMVAAPGAVRATLQRYVH